MAAVTRRPRSLFGEILRRELETQGVSVRELARRTSADPAKLENQRRSLIRYIRGEVEPGAAARDAIAGALSVAPSVFSVTPKRDRRREILEEAALNLVDALMLAVELEQLGDES